MIDNDFDTNRREHNHLPRGKKVHSSYLHDNINGLPRSEVSVDLTLTAQKKGKVVKNSLIMQSKSIVMNVR